jgi:hypothetical protein
MSTDFLKEMAQSGFGRKYPPFLPLGEHDVALSQIYMEETETRERKIQVDVLVVKSSAPSAQGKIFGTLYQVDKKGDSGNFWRSERQRWNEHAVAIAESLGETDFENALENIAEVWQDGGKAARGLLMHVSVTEQTKEGKTFSNRRWSGMENTEESIATCRAAIESLDRQRVSVPDPGPRQAEPRAAAAPAPAATQRRSLLGGRR